MKKKTLRKRIKRQQRLIAQERRTNTVLRGDLRAVDGNARHWRAKYEEAMSSPEIKADTEAAFKRGQDHARQQMRAYFMTALSSMETAEATL